jgi:hypothetical protein
MPTDDQLKVLEEPVDVDLVDTIATDDTIIDLSSYGAAQETLSIGPLTDTITITGLDYSTMTTSITLPQTYTIGSGNGSTYTTSAGYNWSGISASPPTVVLNNDGIDVKEGGDITVKGRSLSEFMSKMEQRMAILVPDPEKLEKFEALKKAYEHYKTMEALCFPEPEEEDKE